MTASGASPLTVKLGGITATPRAAAEGGLAGRAGVWIGTVRGLSTGAARNLTVTSASTIGKIVARVNDLVDWTGGIGAVAADFRTGATNTKAFAVAAAVQSSSGRIAGIGGAVNANCSPLSADGWTRVGPAGASNTVGTAAGASSCADFFNTNGGEPGDATTLRIVSDTGWTDWAAAWVELL